MNIVLFPNAMLDELGVPLPLPVALADGSVQLFRTESISYSHAPVAFYRNEDSDDVIVLGDSAYEADDALRDDWPG